jgi:hypothetical protein
MSDGPEWFSRKRYGFGAGPPIAWQGWAILLAYTAVMGAAVLLLRRSPLALFGVVIPVTAILVLITSRTTRGGWHWRWGGED